ncbi:MAG: glucose-6-phosphate dehydrogenase [Ignavibacteria bacterium]|nr:glucose-6-phosphate dehydrogenase [Ignavibacteria bacterium]
MNTDFSFASEFSNEVVKERIPDPCLMVIFGASGDLTKRMLIPSLYKLFGERLLPENFTVAGFSRKEMNQESFRKAMKEGISEAGISGLFSADVLENFCKRLYYFTADYSDPESYKSLKSGLEEIETERKLNGNRLLYMAVPPDALISIIENIGKSGLNKSNPEDAWTRIILEKPFGHDLESALKLNRKVSRYFSEKQIYRIDHYLGKESVQNILVTRFANGIFEPLWNRNYIDHVEITSSESIGIENRGGYYENSGALKDMVQNHLLQLLGYIAMEPPSTFDSNSIRDESLKVFQSLRPVKKEEVINCVIRGQYTSSHVRGKDVRGYREESGVSPVSRTETYIAMKFFIDNWRWGGVPFYIRTGKRLPTRVTEIVIHFKPTPHHLFKRKTDIAQSYNMLVIRIQPDEGILIKFGMKVPGAGFEVQNVNMDFHYSDLLEAELPSAYEKLLIDCMLGDSTLFIRADAVEACWKFIQPILDAWKEYPEIKVYGYPAGTWGPDCADDLISGKDFMWRYPCKNLSDDGTYCEL